MIEQLLPLLALGLLASFALNIDPADSSYKLPAHQELETKWTKNVSKNLPWPEYPRMQMRRTEWLNLNGEWQFSLGDKPGFDDPATSKQKILVPFAVESKLSGVEKGAHTIWYRRQFTIPTDYQSRQIILHFGAANWETEVWINGQKVGSHQGGYTPFSFDITSALDLAKPAQTIEVRCFNPIDAGTQPRGKQVEKPESIFYTACTGIWQTVWLEPVNRQHIESIHLVPNLPTDSIGVQVNGKLDHCKIEATAYDGSHMVGHQEWQGDGSMSVKLDSLHLWTPDDPFLYRLELKVTANGETVDTVSSYFAMRSMTVQPDAHGVSRLFLNGKPMFQLGPLDQGYWPDGIYTAPTDDALKSDIEEVKKLGMNLIRKHAKVEPDRWYYWADKLGILVWQDMPQTFNKEFPEPVKQEFKQELREMVKSFWNHPSIVVWTLFNEGWGQHDTPGLTVMLKELDPYHLVNSASGWTDKECGDMIDAHHYPEPISPPKPTDHRVRVLGEYGGLGYPVKGHLWTEGWSYKESATPEELTKTYVEYIRDIEKLQETEGLSAAVYTQTTDVEQEINGFFTYDRAIFKMNKQEIRKANEEAIKNLTNLESNVASPKQ